MVRVFRVGYALLAWTFLVALVGQVFLIGLFLFGGGNDARALHADLGWILHLAPLLVLLFAALARAGRSHWLWALGLAIVVFLVPIFATMRESSAVIAALHPVAAMVAFALAVVVAWRSLGALRAPVTSRPVPAPATSEATRP